MHSSEMARPKEKTNTAFQQKCLAASDKLIQFQARTLKDDIERLYTDEVLTDINVDIGCKTIPLHRCILKARSKGLYNYIKSASVNRSGDVTLATKSHSTDIEHCFKSLYTEDDVSGCLEELDKYLDLDTDLVIPEQRFEPPGVDTHGPDNTYRPEAHSSHLHVYNSWRPESASGDDLHVISENITNTSLDLVKCDAISKGRELKCCGDGESESKNSSAEALSRTAVGKETDKATCSASYLRKTSKKCDCNCGSSRKEKCSEHVEERIYRLAETIVEQVIREAQNIVGCVKTNSVDQINNPAMDTKEINENVIADNNVMDKLDEGNSAKLRDSVHKSICTNQNKTSNVSNTGKLNLKSKSGCRFKPSSQGSETLQSLLERVYGVKTLIRPCSQLGEDLLRMLLEQDGSDCKITIQGDEYPAHRCVLAARSSYFAAMLGGSWRESGEDNIVLEGIDAEVLKQTLLYLYGGVVEVDPTCGLGGLVMMADMYGMEGLKEVVAYNLNVQYCHFFHRPCPDCIAGVPEALALTMMYNMDSMKEKCVRWINKNFGKVWASKSLATLPQEVLEFCVSSAVKDLTLNNVLDVMIDCRILNEKTPHLKWTEPVFDMITQLMDAAIEFASQNFISLISGNTFKKIDKEGISFNKQPLEDIFSMIIQALSPENACLAYLSLNKWIKTIEALPEEEAPLFSEEFVDFVTILYKKCREHLCLYIHQAANTQEWELLSKDMQENIMQEANYVCIDTNRGRKARPKLTSMQKKISATSPLSLKEYFECHFGQSKPPSRHLKTKKDVHHESKKGKVGTDRRGGATLIRKGKSTPKATDPRKTPSVALDMKTGKQVPENAGKIFKASTDRVKKTSGKSGQDSDPNQMSKKLILNSDNKPWRDYGSSSSLGSNSLVLEECYDDLSISVPADLELVDLAEGLQFYQEKPLQIFTVAFHVPE